MGWVMAQPSCLCESPQRDLCGLRWPQHQGSPLGTAPSRGSTPAGREAKTEREGSQRPQGEGSPCSSPEVFCALCLPNAEHTGLGLAAVLGSGAAAAQSRGCVSPLPPSGEKCAHISLDFLCAALTHKQLSLLFS